MVVAEIEVFVSPPHAPTRRISMGTQNLPTDNGSEFAAVLIGAIVSRYWGRVDDDVAESLDALVDDVEAGRRLAQPRVRHRLQDDRIGLKRCTHRLVGVGDALRIEVAERPGSPLQHLLAAAYAIASVRPAARPILASAFRYGASWRGELDATFIARLARRQVSIADHGTAHVAWALSVLDLGEGPDGGERRDGVDRREIMRAFRERLVEVHPDLGADDSAAAHRIGELAEARRILMARC